MLLHVNWCTQVPPCTRRHQRTTLKCPFSPSTLGSERSWGYSAAWRASLPSEPSHEPCFVHLKKKSGMQLVVRKLIIVFIFAKLFPTARRWGFLSSLVAFQRLGRKKGINYWVRTLARQKQGTLLCQWVVWGPSRTACTDFEEPKGRVSATKKW